LSGKRLGKAAFKEKFSELKITIVDHSLKVVRNGDIQEF
jgi:hypothetical protein